MQTRNPAQTEAHNSIKHNHHHIYFRSNIRQIHDSMFCAIICYSRTNAPLSRTHTPIHIQRQTNTHTHTYIETEINVHVLAHRAYAERAERTETIIPVQTYPQSSPSHTIHTNISHSIKNICEYTQTHTYSRV